jgi:membrane protein
MPVTWAGLKRALAAAYDDVLNHHTLQVAAALSYYLILAVFPGLTFLSAVMGSIPLPDFFGRVLDLMSRLLPAQTMDLVRKVLLEVLSSNRKIWLSVGMLGIIWMVSAAFDATIEALDIAYDVKDSRPLWKTRLLAIGLGAICGGLLIVALAIMIVGPRFAAWLDSRIPVSHSFVVLWPLVHWVVAISFTILAVEAVYFLAPDVKQRFVATLPGAILAVTCWIGLSYLLGVYFRNFADYNRMYGTLGGFVTFMTWLYWNLFVLLVGAELNAELAKESGPGQILPKSQPASEGTLNRAA